MWRIDSLRVWYIIKYKDSDRINYVPTTTQISPYFLTEDDAREWANENGVRLDDLGGMYKNWKELYGGLTSNRNNLKKPKLHSLQNKTLEIYIKEEKNDNTADC